MKYIIIFFAYLSPLIVFSQSTAPHFEKHAIGKSGAYVYLPGIAEEPTFEYSPDSSKVYTISSSFNDYRFEVIFIQLSEAASSDDLVSPLLEAYLDYLKSSLNVVSSTGYGKGWALNTHSSAIGIKDYWKDKDKFERVVTGWADKKYIAVLVITGTASYPDVTVADVFFKGIRFPGD